MNVAARRVVLDANVLFPASLRDSLLRCAEAGLLEPYWTIEILSELKRNLVSTGAMPAQHADGLVRAITHAFPPAMVTDHERHIPFLGNDLNDRHVVAAAVECGAEAVITLNLKDFATMPDGVEAISPDDLLRELLQREPDSVLQVLKQQHEALRNPPYTFDDMLEALGKFVQAFTDEVREHLGA